MSTTAPGPPRQALAITRETVALDEVSADEVS
jgi:hypothetical protein